MRRVLALMLVTAVFVSTAAAASPPGVRALERLAVKLSGLPEKRSPVVVVASAPVVRAQALRLLDRAYPRGQQAYDETLYRALGLLGPAESFRPALVDTLTRDVPAVYDPSSHVIYTRAGTDSRSTLLAELVHALQDSSFDLRRATGTRTGNRDATLAASAALAGHAAFATQLLGGRGPGPVEAHAGSKLRLFLQLERDFPSTTGLRFVADLQNLGGRPAVLDALHRLPQTTEQIFHLDAFLARRPAAPIELPVSAAGFTLGATDTFGELDVRALLAVFQVPRLDHVGDGWGGGLSGIYRDGSGRQAVALRLDWDSERDAAEWAEAVSTYVNEAFDADVPGFPAQTPCGATACWELDGRAIALVVSQRRTSLVFASSLAQADALARAVTT